MGKLAFLFAGQGAQTPGMGQSLSENSKAARAVFDMADKVRPGTSQQCFEGTAEELSQTINTQPCAWTVDLAAARALTEGGLRPDGVAGFSLGELAALTFAGSFSDEHGLWYVCRRASYMHRAGEREKSGMAAVLKMDDKKIEKLCALYDGVWPANYNSDGQLAVSAKESQLDDFCAAVAEAGGRAKKLAVSGGFHSPMMGSAASTFEGMMAEEVMASPRIPVYANLTAKPYVHPYRKTLAAQIESPVLWKQTIERMAADGYTTFVEVGPGKTLTGLVKRILPEAEVYSVQNYEDCQAVLEALTGDEQKYA